MLISDLLEKYSTAKTSAGYSPETIGRVKRTVRSYSRDMGIAQLNNMTTDSILEWGEWKRQNGRGQSTVYVDFNSIRSFLKFLDDSAIPYPANRRLIYCKPNYQRMVCLRPEEIKKIISVADYEIGILIKLLYTGGMRLSEGLNVASEDLRDDNTIFITGKWCKSRTVFLTPELKQELEWLAPEGGYCFRDHLNPHEPMNRKNAYYHIKRAMKQAGYPQAYPHSLRHGFTTTMIRQGANLSQVQRLLGHSNITTTQRYEHLVTDDLADAHREYLISI